MPKSGGKQRTTIRNDRLWHTVQTHDVGYVEIRQNGLKVRLDILLDLVNSSIRLLSKLDLIHQGWVHNQGSTRLVLNHTQVETLKVYKEGRLQFLEQQCISKHLSTKCICNNISLAGMVMNFHVVVFDQLQPSPLPKVQVRLGEQILQALVVRIHLTAITD